ncbi:hypothetical protein CSPX01_06821, partial [Colletotrichum filicis]
IFQPCLPKGLGPLGRGRGSIYRSISLVDEERRVWRDIHLQRAQEGDFVLKMTASREALLLSSGINRI